MHYIEINIFVEKALTSFSKIDESEDTETSEADGKALIRSSKTGESEDVETVEDAGDGTSIPDVAVEKEVQEFPTKETGYKHNMTNSNNNNGNLYGTL
ncbi:unnamed protein product [Rotaria sp. Silwood1]|nr:unnamed protein product [Rotaria sp. Silwood1]